MAHLAEIGPKSTVLSVIRIGDEYEEDCERFYGELTGKIWKRTSYNTFGGVHRLGGTPFRYNYAGIGFIFDPTVGDHGAFRERQPYPSWTLNPDTQIWEAPLPLPTDPTKAYSWSETAQNWVIRS